MAPSPLLGHSHLHRPSHEILALATQPLPVPLRPLSLQTALAAREQPPPQQQLDLAQSRADNPSSAAPQLPAADSKRSADAAPEPGHNPAPSKRKPLEGAPPRQPRHAESVGAVGRHWRRRNQDADDDDNKGAAVAEEVADSGIGSRSNMGRRFDNGSDRWIARRNLVVGSAAAAAADESGIVVVVLLVVGAGVVGTVDGVVGAAAAGLPGERRDPWRVIC